jgi:SAM-dependent methyltransferase
VAAEDLRGDIQRLALTRSSRLVDLGAGPCGPLTFLLAAVGCRGTGVELSSAALEVGRRRAAALGVDALLSVREADLNQPLPFESRAFDAAVSFDTVLHLHDRAVLFAEVARLLRPGGRFLLVDAAVVTGPISNDEVRRRSPHGYSQFVPPGWNEKLLEAAGLRLLESEDLTRCVLRNGSGRLKAMRAHRAEFERVFGAAEFERQQEYLETMLELSRRRALSRMMYLAGT